MKVVSLILVLGFFLSHGSATPERGAQLRLTDKGLKYGIDCAISTFENDIVGKPIAMKKFEKGKLTLDVKNAMIKTAKINRYNLKTVENVGLKANVEDIYMVITTDFEYKYKWWFTLKDTLKLTAIADGASFEIDLEVGKRPDGRPSLKGKNCKADVGDLNMKFSSSSIGWLYNIIEKVLRSTIKSRLNNMLCDLAIKELQERGDKELQSFPVKRRINRYANVDYSLTSKPAFSSDYMDIYLKGAITSPTQKKKIPFDAPDFAVDSDASKMAYLWVSNYTFNTAGQTFHTSGALKYTITVDDHNLPLLLKRVLKKTSEFAKYIPKILSHFPDAGLELDIKSSKAPRVQMVPGEITLFAFSEITLKAIIGKERYDVFVLELDVNVGGEIKVHNDNIIGNIRKDDFKYDIKLKRSNIGDFDVAVLDSPFVENVITTGILKQVQPFLHKGFPMPTIKDLSFVNSDIDIMKDFIAIRTDCKFITRANTEATFL